jgi:ATP synthase protein I
MSDDGAEDPLRELGQRLDKARRGEAPRPSNRPIGTSAENALGLAWRIGIELVVAIVVATGIGWAIDHWLGTRPWAMIVFFFLGVAAGMFNVWRAVTGMSAAMGYRQQNGSGSPPPQGQWDDDED